MKLEELRSPRKLVVVYGGRFQPPHLGHYHAYLWLCRRFGADDVWLATSNKTNFKAGTDDVSPFSYAEKVELFTQLYGVKPRRVVECANPAFRPVEVFELYKGYRVTYVAACGSKDKERYAENSFFQPLARDAELSELKALDEDAGYYVTIPARLAGVSGSTVREELSTARGAAVRRLFEKFFGTYDKELAELVTARLREVHK